MLFAVYPFTLFDKGGAQPMQHLQVIVTALGSNDFSTARKANER